MPSLRDVIEKLRQQHFCLYELVESGKIPEELVGLLVCDYVDHLQLRLQRAGIEIHACGKEAVLLKRQWLAGRASNVQLGRMRAVIQQQMALRPHDDVLFFAWAATFASSEKALCAVLEGLRRRAHCLQLEFPLELRWIGRRLAACLEERVDQQGNIWTPLARLPHPLAIWSFNPA